MISLRLHPRENSNFFRPCERYQFWLETQMGSESILHQSKRISANNLELQKCSGLIPRAIKKKNKILLLLPNQWLEK
jgi:hypothetical protein